MEKNNPTVITVTFELTHSDIHYLTQYNFNRLLDNLNGSNGKEGRIAAVKDLNDMKSLLNKLISTTNNTLLS